MYNGNKYLLCCTFIVCQPTLYTYLIITLPYCGVILGGLVHPDNRKSFRKQWYQMWTLRRWLLHKTRKHGMFVFWVRELSQAVSWVLQKNCVESCSHGSCRIVCTEVCLYFFQKILTLYLQNHSTCLIKLTTINSAEVTFFQYA